MRKVCQDIKKESTLFQISENKFERKVSKVGYICSEYLGITIRKYF